METVSQTYRTAEEKQRKVVTAVASYGKGLLGFIRKRVGSDADAEDVLQDVWFQLSSIINSQPVEQLGAWLYRVAQNRSIDKHRKKKEYNWHSRLNDEQESAEMEQAFAGDDNPELEYRERIIWQQLYRALDELPVEQRDVFIWHELDDIPFAEIAALTGEPVSKLVMRKRYAVLHLRKRMKIYYDELKD